MGLFIGATEANGSPLEPGTFHLPARCAFTLPSAAVPDDQWPRWNGGECQVTQCPPIDTTCTICAKSRLAKEGLI